MGQLFSILQRLITGKKDLRILILGLDGAGKTTLLYRLKSGEMIPTLPTIGFNMEEIQFKNLKFQAWDLGGQMSIRPYWRCYYANADAIIYMVDSSDQDRLCLSRDELFKMLLEEELRHTVLLVMANKQDVAGCMTAAQVHQALGLDSIRDRTFNIFKTSVTKADGLDSAFDWLSDVLNK